MMGIAAGMTIGENTIYRYFANFSTSRVYDQIRQSIAYSGKKKNMCISPGLTLEDEQPIKC